ncbi:alpha/beta hydrolase [Spirulina sp. 06S082]|uniref:alpha/beta hydrolase n=1 Tax=Spirulina sp. 06S082 TaxID=3110248 RepID=UPI002B206707|nr:alpha/beta hydrolase [Spirulina sp. 06S082]MEA5471661.1 alpha/beta hydrolase [Spirulina sp. 06S082]
MSLESQSILPRNGQKPNRLLVMLHGWGANFNDLTGLVDLLDLPDYQFLFPNAPFPHFQIPGGRAWYALEREEREGLTESRQLLLEWLRSLPEETGIPFDRTVLFGFSQGAAMTLDVGFELPFAGLCSFSGYLHAPPQGKKTSPPTLIVHGDRDPVVPVQAAREVKEILSKQGVTIEYCEFAMAHEIDYPALVTLKKFLKNLY